MCGGGGEFDTVRGRFLSDVYVYKIVFTHKTTL